MELRDVIAQQTLLGPFSMRNYFLAAKLEGRGPGWQQDDDPPAHNDGIFCSGEDKSLSATLPLRIGEFIASLFIDIERFPFGVVPPQKIVSLLASSLPPGLFLPKLYLEHNFGLLLPSFLHPKANFFTTNTTKHEY